MKMPSSREGHDVPLRVLLVEDDDACADFVIEAFEEAPERVLLTRKVRLQEALHELETGTVDVVLLDLTLPDAFDLLGVNAIRRIAPEVPLVVLTGSLNAALGAQVIAAGADDYLQKDQVDASVLVRSIWYARDRRAYLKNAGWAENKQRTLVRPRPSDDDPLGGSLDVEALLATVAAVALPELAASCTLQVRDDDDTTQRADIGGASSDAIPADEVEAVMQSGRPSPLGGSTLIVPLVVRGKVTGTLQLRRPAAAARYGEADLDLAVELARRATLALESARLYQMSQATIEHRNVFRSIASHEVRKPLSRLQIQIDRMQRTLQIVSPDIQAMARSAKRLNRYMSTVDSIALGKLVLEPAEVDLVELAREVADRHHTDCRGSSVKVLQHGTGQVKGVWDGLLLEQVITNLLHNAAKYDGGKLIDLTVGTEVDFATFSVQDRGSGMAAPDLARVFDRFELYVSRQIIEAHGGSIEVKSLLGHGTSFTVRLPRRPAGARADATDATTTRPLA